MIRKSTHTIEEILPLIGSAEKVMVDGDLVGMRSLRLINFKVHGITCVTPGCGLVGKFFAKEKSHKRDGSYHLNLYAVREDGTEVLMTQDHILAKSMGGDNVLENLEVDRVLLLLDHVTSPTTFCILFKLNGLVHQQLIISVRDTGRYQSGVNYRELKTFFHALKNRINLPLCINYEWANELLKAALQDDDTW
jgi:hypothetical protein